MPIKKRSDIGGSKFIFADDKVLVVRTPPATAKWPNDFRVALVRDYIPPNTMMLTKEFEDRFIKSGLNGKRYRVQGHDLQVSYSYENLVNANKVLVQQANVFDHTTKRGMKLAHSNPAMRCLIVYAFVSGHVISNLPIYTTFEV